MNRNLTIESGSLSATISTTGATILDLTSAGRHLLAGPGRPAPDLGHHGAVLAPWPNRVHSGRYSFDGQSHQLEINEPAFGHAIHGVVYSCEWQLLESSPTHVLLRTEIRNVPGYPFEIQLDVEYHLSDSVFECHVRWANVGQGRAPFAIGFHPYLRPGDGPVDHWTLQVPAEFGMDSHPETKLPMPNTSVVGTAADFRDPKLIGGSTFSRAYQLEPQADQVIARLSGPDGLALAMGASPAFRWLQVYTGDVPTPDLHRKGVALEPQTSPPNALVTGQDLLILDPGAEGSAQWWLRVSHAG